MAKRLVIVGAGGHGKVCAECAELTGNWEEIVFIDRLFPSLRDCGKWKVIGSDTLGTITQDDDIFVAVGGNHVRFSVYESFADSDSTVVSLIHPKAIVSKYASIGRGVLVCAGAIIGTGSVIGDYSIINTQVSIDHDCNLGRAVHMSPGVSLAGEVRVGEFSWLGTGVSTKQQVNISTEVIVGVGAAIINDLCEPGTYVGVPARKID